MKTFWRVPIAPHVDDEGQEVSNIQGGTKPGMRFYLQFKLPVGIVKVPVTESQYRVLCAEIRRGVSAASIFAEPASVEDEPPTSPHRRSLPPQP